MKYNYFIAKKKFDEEWKKLEQSYLEAGMAPSDIQKMRAFDWQVFCDNRVQITHKHDTIPEEQEEIAERTCVCYDIYGGHSRYWWLEEISNPCLTFGIPLLSDEDKELLTLYIVEQYSIREIAARLGKQKSSVSERLQRIFSLFPTSP